MTQSDHVSLEQKNPSQLKHEATLSPSDSAVTIGLSTEDFFERESGGAHHKAMFLYDLESAVEGARHEWEYDESSEAVELHRLCSQLDDYLKRLSITRNDGTLTLYRECRRCGGAGQFPDENPCVECGGKGAIHADEAEG